MSIQRISFTGCDLLAGLLWRLAREELTAATEVVFVGVSFAPSDYYLRWLIKSSFLESDRKKKSIEVVDRCLTVKDKIKEMVDIDPVCYPNIKTYISKQTEQKHTNFKNIDTRI